MKENRPNQTDQQATNAALAALAAAGNTFALGQLWEVNKGFLHRLFWQWYSKNKAIADNAGLTLEDFDQAIADGYDNIPDLADYFNVTEDFMRKAVCFYIHGNLAAELYF